MEGKEKEKWGGGDGKNPSLFHGLLPFLTPQHVHSQSFHFLIECLRFHCGGVDVGRIRDEGENPKTEKGLKGE